MIVGSTWQRLDLDQQALGRPPCGTELASCAKVKIFATALMSVWVMSNTAPVACCRSTIEENPRRVAAAGPFPRRSPRARLYTVRAAFC